MRGVPDLSELDRSCLDTAIVQARLSFEGGNFPVGAALAVGEQMIAEGNNTGETSRDYSNHAELGLIFGNGARLLQSVRENDVSTLYSTLEPCIMCLGTAVMNKITRIVYIQSDPHAGACNVDRESMSLRYQEIWPDIIHAKGYSSQPKDLVVAFLRRQIARDVRLEWSQARLREYEAEAQ